MNEFDKFKPLLLDFIKIYYQDLGNSTGGNLHIALDDGNLSEGNLWFCQQLCEKNDDSFGLFLVTLMRTFTEQELEEFYDDCFWGMEK